MLVHDCQFSEAEYRDRVGWGTRASLTRWGSPRTAGVGRLVLFHHDPDRTDDAVDGLVERAHELWNGTAECCRRRRAKGCMIEVGA